jgi:hypothetical protein
MPQTFKTLLQSLLVGAAMCILSCEGLPVVSRNINPTLPSPIVFQDLNIFQLTDVHSWLSGHHHELKEEADVGDTVRRVLVDAVVNLSIKLYLQ